MYLLLEHPQLLHGALQLPGEVLGIPADNFIMPSLYAFYFIFAGMSASYVFLHCLHYLSAYLFYCMLYINSSPLYLAALLLLPALSA